LLTPEVGLEDFQNSLRGNLGCPAKLGSLLLEFVSSGGLTREINGILTSLLNREAAVLSRIGTDMIMLLEDNDFVLQLKRFSGHDQSNVLIAPESFLCTPASNAVVLLKGGATIKTRRYKIDHNVDLDVFSPSAKIVLVEELTYDGSVCHEQVSPPMVYEYVSRESFVMIRLAYRPFADQCWHFNSASHIAAFPSAGLMDQSALVNTAKVLGAIGDVGALPHLFELGTHPSHFVRWASIQAAGQIDRDVATRLLMTATNDAHPHIRAMSTKTLIKLGHVHG